MLARAMVADGGMPASRPIQPGEVLAGGESLTAGAISTAGDGTWTGAAIATGIIRRTGPGGAYADVTDTATAILAALKGNMANVDVVPGTSIRLIVQNTVAFANTVTGGTGVRLGTGTVNIAASLVREYLLTVLNASPEVTLNCATTNASAVVTFNLPTGMNALPIGPAPNAVNITPGMTVSGTGITAGTRVLGVTQGVGGITGVTLDANATATNNPVSLTFGPTLLLDGIRSSTL